MTDYNHSDFDAPVEAETLPVVTGTAVAAATQTAYPWRTVIRTVAQVVGGFAIALGIVFGIISADIVPLLAESDQAQWNIVLGLGTAITAGITKFMNDPRINGFLTSLNLGASPRGTHDAVVIVQEGTEGDD